MGISRLDALAIQNNEVYVDAFPNQDGTAYGMTIYLLKGGEIDRPSVSTDGFPYSSKREAERGGKDLVEEIRKVEIEVPLARVLGEKIADIRKEMSEGEE